jgi:hypothetical protein
VSFLWIRNEASFGLKHWSFKKKTRVDGPGIPNEAERRVAYDPYREMGAEVLHLNGND